MRKLITVGDVSFFTVKHIVGSTIIHNTLGLSNKGNTYGIYMRYAQFTNVCYNEIIDNSNYGAYIQSTIGIYNVFHHNNFIDNKNEGTQAYDSTTYTEWDNGNIDDDTGCHGNYWDDLGSSQTYDIAGVSGNDDDDFPITKMTWT